MPNQELVTTLQVAASVDKILPGLDPQNVGNLNFTITDIVSVTNDPKQFVLQPASNKILNLLPAKGTYLLIKTDQPITAQFGSGTTIPVATILAISGDYIALGALTLANPGTANAANIEVISIGI